MDQSLTGLLDNRHAVRVHQLAIPLALVAKLKLETALAVEYLYAMVVCVGDNDIILGVDSHTARFREQTW